MTTVAEVALLVGLRHHGNYNSGTTGHSIIQALTNIGLRRLVRLQPTLTTKRTPEGQYGVICPIATQIVKEICIELDWGSKIPNHLGYWLQHTNHISALKRHTLNSANRLGEALEHVTIQIDDFSGEIDGARYVHSSFRGNAAFADLESKVQQRIMRVRKSAEKVDSALKHTQLQASQVSTPIAGDIWVNDEMLML